MDLKILVLETITKHQPILGREVARLINLKTGMDVSKQEVNSLLYGELRAQVTKNDLHQWSIKNNTEASTYSSQSLNQDTVEKFESRNASIAEKFLVGKNSSSEPKIDTALSGNSLSGTNQLLKNSLNLSNLTKYYLDALSYERDSEIKLFAKPFDKAKPNFLMMNGLPIYDDNTAVWPANTREYIASKPRSKNVNLYIGYPVFVQKTRPDHSDIVFPFFLFNLKLNEADLTGFPSLDIDPPRINSEAFKETREGFGEIQDDLKYIRNTLGLDVEIDSQLPNIVELIERLKTKFPVWPWQELLDISNLSISSLDSKENGGFYNSAILFWGEGSKYVQGLENELTQISSLTADRYSNSVLSKILEVGSKVNTGVDQKEIHRHLPLNPSQAEAVHSALSNPLTVITGPPGTGKSQVVGSIISNAAINKQSILFSSRNHKAVDVVVERINGLSNQPFLIKLGSESSTSDISFLVNILTNRIRNTDTKSIELLRARSQELRSELNKQQVILEEAVERRNKIDEISKTLPENLIFIENHINLRGDKSVLDKAKLLEEFSDKITIDLEKLSKRKNSIDTQKFGLIQKIVWPFRKKSLLKANSDLLRKINDDYKLKILPIENVQSYTQLLEFSEKLILTLENLLVISKRVLFYYKDLSILTSFDMSANQSRLVKIEDQLATVDLEYWQEWLRILPDRLSSEEIQTINNYASLVQLANVGEENEKRKVSERIKKLTQKMTHALPAWAITSLSLRNRIPFDDGLFDLVVIDEASQCDIASAIPLLYRAKRAVIIGDPQQLKHITSLSKASDSRLMSKYGIIDHPVWGYSINSLFDAMAANPIANRITLNEHHRSDAAIINFSNRHFYDGNLIVATRLSKLNHSKSTPSLDWVNITGQVVSPSGSGALNSDEVAAVQTYLRELLITRGYKGTVGVVTPFRKQANQLRNLIENDTVLQPVLESSKLIIDTVHKFQGDERDVIVFSPVISRGISSKAVGFLRSQGNLFNVAITRARSHLVIVGDFESCQNSEIKYMTAFAKYYSEFKSSVISEKINESDLPLSHPLSSDPRVSIWEVKLYAALRSAGLSPIPQYSEDKYALDFALFRKDGAKLDIEVDGEMYHKSWTGQPLRSDTIRNQTLIELGWYVKRFWVYQLKEDLNGCVNEIVAWANNS